mmetsp:Transcript_24297/g.37531  ORF Transcript_24297/g.37531 Transcript_24297/m.37531 type:complete len:87 (-) Transcript_24297:2276-2536(-)
MDCQFLMVPKQLVDQVLTFRLLTILRKLMTLVSPFEKNPSQEDIEKQAAIAAVAATEKEAEESKEEEVAVSTPVSWLTKESMAVFF